MTIPSERCEPACESQAGCACALFDLVREWSSRFTAKAHLIAEYEPGADPVKDIVEQVMVDTWLALQGSIALEDWPAPEEAQT